ncbi:hypothetical protein WA026_011417 [Henosepilachna vigintioctopunctata]|uniref:Peptidase S1 domain-containing protein n=1 Tax=Henosepilachna vigintioctopunctata TaxID=420089 RepID=A0AAW1TS19_9CUCU
MELLDRQLVAAGWGSTEIVHSFKNYTAIASPELKCVNVSYITFEECFKLSKSATRKHICAISKAGGEASCKGDSGGPLFQGRTIYGIVSWGYECGILGSPQFYTRVDKYLDFIDDTMRAGANKPASLYSISIFLIISVYIYLNKFDTFLTDL